MVKSSVCVCPKTLTNCTENQGSIPCLGILYILLYEIIVNNILKDFRYLSKFLITMFCAPYDYIVVLQSVRYK